VTSYDALNPYVGVTPHETASTGPARRGRTGARLLVIVTMLVAVIFAFDLWLPTSVALGSIYIVPVFLSVWNASRKLTAIVAAVCTLLTPIGAWIDFGTATALHERLSVGADPDARVALLVLVNSANALFAIWVTTGLGLMRIETERELVESRELSAIALASVGDAVITADNHGRIASMNAVAEELTGWPRAQAQGRPLADVLHFAKPRVPPGQEEFASALSLDDVFELVRRDGGRRLVERRRSPIRDAMGAERGQVLMLRDAGERVDQGRAMLELAFRDPLTGLSNRHSLLERLELELAHARRDGRRMALLFLDLDQFKPINDTLGHHVGDEILRRIAQRLRSGLREADTVARLGGDEFTILVPGIGSVDDALAVAAKVDELVAAPLDLDGRSLEVRASIGVAVFPDHARDAAGLLRAGDAAMYDAKRRPGHAPALYEPRHAPNPGEAQVVLVPRPRRASDTRVPDIGTGVAGARDGERT
jgi:diguanylate cyclase (GGDEF)-like protein/PAS domain S-box-containing protein